MNICLPAVFATLLSLAGCAETNDKMDHPKTPPQSDATHKDPMRHMGELKVGMSADRVLALLGEPKGKNGNLWSYSSLDDAPHPLDGSIEVIGFTLTFKGKVLAKIDHVVGCFVGSPGPLPKKTPEKKAE